MRLAAGSRGSRSAPCASVRSVPYLAIFLAQNTFSRRASSCRHHFHSSAALLHLCRSWRFLYYSMPIPTQALAGNPEMPVFAHTPVGGTVSRRGCYSWLSFSECGRPLPDSRTILVNFTGLFVRM